MLPQKHPPVYSIVSSLIVLFAYLSQEQSDFTFSCHIKHFTRLTGICVCRTHHALNIINAQIRIAQDVSEVKGCFA